MTKTTVEHWNGQSVEIRRLNSAPAIVIKSPPWDFGYDIAVRGYAVTFDPAYAAQDDLIFEANGLQVVVHLWLEYQVSCDQLSHCIAQLSATDMEILDKGEVESWRGWPPHVGKTGSWLGKRGEDPRYAFRDRLGEEASWLSATTRARARAAMREKT